MKVSNQQFSKIVKQAKMTRQDNPDQSLDAVAMNCINHFLDVEEMDIDQSEKGDLLFRVVYAMRD